MEQPSKRFENYPGWIVLITNLVSVSVYFAGLYLIYLVWEPLALLYLIYIIYLEVSLYKESCVSCYYFGKVCAFGKGKIAKVFFKKGDPQKFCEKTFSFKDLMPQILVSIIPMVAGIYLLIKNFNFLILGVTLWPIIIWIFGNPVVYGKLACPNCKQAQICCNACEFFMKRKARQLAGRKGGEKK